MKNLLLLLCLLPFALVFSACGKKGNQIAPSPVVKKVTLACEAISSEGRTMVGDTVDFYEGNSVVKISGSLSSERTQAPVTVSGEFLPGASISIVANYASYSCSLCPRSEGVTLNAYVDGKLWKTATGLSSATIVDNLPTE